MWPTRRRTRGRPRTDTWLFPPISLVGRGRSGLLRYICSPKTWPWISGDGWVDNLAPVLLSACSWQWGLFQTVTVNWVSLFHISCRLIAPPDRSDWIRLAAPQKHKVWLSGWWGFFTGDKHVSRKEVWCGTDKTLSCLQCFIFAVETWSVFLDSQTQTDTFVLMFDGKFTEPGETTLLLRGYSRDWNWTGTKLRRFTYRK